MAEEAEMTFEESLRALEKLVRDLEGGSLPLDEAIKAYEQAAVLRDRCRKTLEDAERRVQKLIGEEGQREDLVIG